MVCYTRVAKEQYRVYTTSPKHKPKQFCLMYRIAAQACHSIST
jgi:hypothetical protein